MGIIAGSLGHWVVNKEPKMVEMLLSSNCKGMNKNSMSKIQKVKFNQHGMGDYHKMGEVINFSIFGCKSVEMAINLAGLLSEDQKMSFSKEI